MNPWSYIPLKNIATIVLFLPTIFSFRQAFAQFDPPLTAGITINDYEYSSGLYPNLFLPNKYRHGVVPENIVKEQKMKLEAAVRNVLQRMVVVITDEETKKTVDVLYFDFILREAKKIDPEVKIIPSGGVVRAVLAYIYDEMRKGKTLESFITDKKNIRGSEIRGVSSDFDIFAVSKNGKFDEIKSRILQITNSSEEEFDLRNEKSVEKRSIFTVGDTKEFNAHLERSVPQGGSVLDFLGYDYESRKFIGSDRYPRIIEDFIRGSYQYIAPADSEKQKVENFHKQLIRGFRPLVEIPFLHIFDETEIRSELDQAISDLEQDKFPIGSEREKALEQFSKMLRNSRDYGAKNRMWRGKEGSIENIFMKYANLIRDKITHKNPFPEFVQYQSLEKRKTETMPIEFLISTKKFNTELTNNGVFYHGSPSLDNALAIIRGGLFESYQANGGKGAYGKGAYSSHDFETSAGYANSEGIVFELQLAKSPNIHILDYKTYLNTEHFKKTVQEAKLFKMDHFDYLMWKYGVDLIVNHHIIIKNAAAINMENGLLEIAKGLALNLRNKNISLDIRVRKYKTFMNILKFAVQSGDFGDITKHVNVEEMEFKLLVEILENNDLKYLRNFLEIYDKQDMTVRNAHLPSFQKSLSKSTTLALKLFRPENEQLKKQFVEDIIKYEGKDNVSLGDTISIYLKIIKYFGIDINSAQIEGRLFAFYLLDELSSKSEEFTKDFMKILTDLKNHGFKNWAARNDRGDTFVRWILRYDNDADKSLSKLQKLGLTNWSTVDDHKLLLAEIAIQSKYPMKSLAKLQQLGLLHLDDVDEEHRTLGHLAAFSKNTIEALSALEKFGFNKWNALDKRGSSIAEDLLKGNSIHPSKAMTFLKKVGFTEWNTTNTSRNSTLAMIAVDYSDWPLEALVALSEMGFTKWRSRDVGNNDLLYIAMWEKSSFWRLYDDSIPYLEALKQIGYFDSSKNIISDLEYFWRKANLSIEEDNNKFFDASKGSSRGSFWSKFEYDERKFNDFLDDKIKNIRIAQFLNPIMEQLKSNPNEDFGSYSLKKKLKISSIDQLNTDFLFVTRDKILQNLTELGLDSNFDGTQIAINKYIKYISETIEQSKKSLDIELKNDSWSSSFSANDFSDLIDIHSSKIVKMKNLLDLLYNAKNVSEENPGKTLDEIKVEVESKKITNDIDAFEDSKQVGRKRDQRDYFNLKNGLRPKTLDDILNPVSSEFWDGNVHPSNGGSMQPSAKQGQKINTTAMNVADQVINLPDQDDKAPSDVQSQTNIPQVKNDNSIFGKLKSFVTGVQSSIGSYFTKSNAVSGSSSSIDLSTNDPSMPVHDYLNGIIQKLLDRVVTEGKDKFDYELFIDANDTVNAHISPWNEKTNAVAINKGLLSFAYEMGEGTVAYVLGHEMGHFYDGDTDEIRDIEKTKDIREWVKKLANRRVFSKEQEYKADMFGVRLMIQAGYDPADAIAFLEALGKSNNPMILKMISSHPEPNDRVIALAKYIDELKKNLNLKIRPGKIATKISQEMINQLNYFYDEQNLIKNGKYEEAIKLIITKLNEENILQYQTSLKYLIEVIHNIPLDKVSDVSILGFEESISNILTKYSSDKHYSPEKYEADKRLSSNYNAFINLKHQIKESADHASLNIFYAELNKLTKIWNDRHRISYYEWFLEQRNNKQLYQSFKAEENIVFLIDKSMTKPFPAMNNDPIREIFKKDYLIQGHTRAHSLIFDKHIQRITNLEQFWDVVETAKYGASYGNHMSTENSLHLLQKYLALGADINGLEKLSHLITPSRSDQPLDVVDFPAALEVLNQIESIFKKNSQSLRIDEKLELFSSINRSLKSVFYNRDAESALNHSYLSFSDKWMKNLIDDVDPDEKNIILLAEWYLNFYGGGNESDFFPSILNHFNSYEIIKDFIVKELVNLKKTDSKDDIKLGELTLHSSNRYHFIQHIATAAEEDFFDKLKQGGIEKVDLSTGVFLQFFSYRNHDDELSSIFDSQTNADEKRKLLKNFQSSYFKAISELKGLDYFRKDSFFVRNTTQYSLATLLFQFREKLVASEDYIESNSSVDDVERIDQLFEDLIGEKYSQLPNLMKQLSTFYKDKDSNDLLLANPRRYITLYNLDKSATVRDLDVSLNKMKVSFFNQREIYSKFYNLSEILSKNPSVGMKHVKDMVEKANSIEEKNRIIRAYGFFNEGKSIGVTPDNGDIINSRVVAITNISDISAYLNTNGAILNNLVESIKTGNDYNSIIDSIKALLFEVSRTNAMYVKGSQAELLVSSIQSKLYEKWKSIPEFKGAVHGSYYDDRVESSKERFLQSITNFNYEKYGQAYQGGPLDYHKEHFTVTSSFTDSIYDLKYLTNKYYHSTEYNELVDLFKYNSSTQNNNIYQNSVRLDLLDEWLKNKDSKYAAKLIKDVYSDRTSERDDVIQTYIAKRTFSSDQLQELQKLHSRSTNKTPVDVTISLNILPTMIGTLSPQASLETFLWITNIQDLPPTGEGKQQLQEYVRSEKSGYNNFKFSSLAEIKNSFDILPSDQQKYLLFYLLSHDSEILEEQAIRLKLKEEFLTYANGTKNNIDVPNQLKLIYESMLRSYESDVTYGNHRIKLSEFYANIFPYLATIAERPEKIATVILQSFGLIGDKTMQLLAEENIPDQYKKEFAKAQTDARPVILFESLEWLDEKLNPRNENGGIDIEKQNVIKQKLMDLGVQGLDDKSVIQWSDVFESVKNIGSASVKIVLGGVLKNEKKTNVAILIMRKNLENSTNYALNLVRNVMDEMIQSSGDQNSKFVAGLKVFVDRLDRVTKKEFDFPNEAKNLDRITENLKEGDKITKVKLSTKLGDHYDIEVSTPEVFLSAYGLLLMTEIEGTKLKDIAEANTGVNLTDLYKKIIDVGAQQVFEGFADFDRHPGNWIVGQKDGKSQLVFIDAGQADDVTKEQREQIISLFLTMKRQNVSSIISKWKKMLDGKVFDLDQVKSALQQFLKDHPKADSGRILVELMKESVSAGNHIAVGYDSIFQLLKMLQNYSEKIDAKDSYLEKSFGVFAKNYARENPSFDIAYEALKTRISDWYSNLKDQVVNWISPSPQTNRSNVETDQKKELSKTNDDRANQPENLSTPRSGKTGNREYRNSNGLKSPTVQDIVNGKSLSDDSKALNDDNSNLDAMLDSWKAKKNNAEKEAYYKAHQSDLSKMIDQISPSRRVYLVHKLGEIHPGQELAQGAVVAFPQFVVSKMISQVLMFCRDGHGPEEAVDLIREFQSNVQFAAGMTLGTTIHDALVPVMSQALAKKYEAQAETQALRMIEKPNLRGILERDSNLLTGLTRSQMGMLAATMINTALDPKTNGMSGSQFTEEVLKSQVSFLVSEALVKGIVLRGILATADLSKNVDLVLTSIESTGKSNWITGAVVLGVELFVQDSLMKWVNGVEGNWKSKSRLSDEFLRWRKTGSLNQRQSLLSDMEVYWNQVVESDVADVVEKYKKQQRIADQNTPGVELLYMQTTGEKTYPIVDSTMGYITGKDLNQAPPSHVYGWTNALMKQSYEKEASATQHKILETADAQLRSMAQNYRNRQNLMLATAAHCAGPACGTTLLQQTQDYEDAKIDLRNYYQGYNINNRGNMYDDLENSFMFDTAKKWNVTMWAKAMIRFAGQAMPQTDILNAPVQAYKDSDDMLENLVSKLLGDHIPELESSVAESKLLDGYIISKAESLLNAQFHQQNPKNTGSLKLAPGQDGNPFGLFTLVIPRDQSETDIENQIKETIYNMAYVKTCNNLSSYNITRKTQFPSVYIHELENNKVNQKNYSQLRSKVPQDTWSKIKTLMQASTLDKDTFGILQVIQEVKLNNPRDPVPHRNGESYTRFEYQFPISESQLHLVQPYFQGCH